MHMSVSGWVCAHGLECSNVCGHMNMYTWGRRCMSGCVYVCVCVWCMYACGDINRSSAVCVCVCVVCKHGRCTWVQKGVLGCARGCVCVVHECRRLQSHEGPWSWSYWWLWATHHGCWEVIAVKDRWAQRPLRNKKCHLWHIPQLLLLSVDFEKSLIVEATDLCDVWLASHQLFWKRCLWMKSPMG